MRTMLVKGPKEAQVVYYAILDEDYAKAVRALEMMVEKDKSCLYGGETIEVDTEDIPEYLMNKGIEILPVEAGDYDIFLNMEDFEMEYRTIRMDDIEKLCNEKNWFTLAGQRQRETLMQLLKGATAHDIALAIWICSDSAVCKLGEVEEEVKKIYP